MHFDYRNLYLSKSYLSFNRRYFRNQPIWNKNCLWRSCLLTNRDKMSNLYRVPSIKMHLSLYRFLKIFSSETAWPNEPKLGRKHLWKVICWPSTKQTSSSSHWKLTCSRHWYSWKIAELALNNTHSLTPISTLWDKCINFSAHNSLLE
jgi:hypothetical protein